MKTIQEIQAKAITSIAEINWRANNVWKSDYQSIESTQYLNGCMVIQYVNEVEVEHERHGNGSPITFRTEFINIKVPLTETDNVDFKALYDLVEQAMEEIQEVEINETIV